MEFEKALVRFSDNDCATVVDIAFIIDSSGSISRRNWERVKRFVKAATSKLDVSSSGTRVAAIAYSTDPEVVMRFNDYQGTDEVNRGFDGMRHQRGYTYTDKALELADRDVFQFSNGMRLNVPKVSKNYISSLETGITISLIDSKIILPKFCLPPPPGVLRISSDGDDEWGSNQNPKIPSPLEIRSISPGVLVGVRIIPLLAD